MTLKGGRDPQAGNHCSKILSRQYLSTWSCGLLFSSGFFTSLTSSISFIQIFIFYHFPPKPTSGLTLSRFLLHIPVSSWPPWIPGHCSALSVDPAPSWLPRNFLDAAAYFIAVKHYFQGTLFVLTLFYFYLFSENDLHWKISR